MIVAFLARAPFAMIPLGVMTAFTASTGSVAIGGAATAVVSLSTAFMSPFLGRASDVWGQRRLLLLLVPLNALALLGLFLVSLQPSINWSLWLLCAATGVTTVPVGSFTRARWAAATRTPYHLSAAFSYESMADELVFVLGPALVGIASSTGAASAPLGLACLLMVLAGIPFALSAPNTTDLAATATDVSNPAVTARPSIFKVLLIVLPSILILMSVGAYFGSIQAGTTVRAEAFGDPGSAGLVYATLGVGSAITSLLVVMIPEKIRLSVRILVCSVGMGTMLLLVNAQESLPTTAVLLGLAGIWVGPTLVSAFTMTEKIAPSGGLTVALTAMQSSVTVGVSVGSAFGGILAEQRGESGAYFFAVAACGLIFIVAALLQLPLFRRKYSTI